MKADPGTRARAREQIERISARARGVNPSDDPSVSSWRSLPTRARYGLWLLGSSAARKALQNTLEALYDELDDVRAEVHAVARDVEYRQAALQASVEALLEETRRIAGLAGDGRPTE